MSLTVDIDALRRHVDALSVQRSPFTHSENLDAAFRYVKTHFEQSGLETLVDPFHVGPRRFRNVLGMVRPPSGEGATVVLAAHVDAVVDSPGADDNASGVAGLIECARRLAQYTPKCTICFAATDLEECGIQGGRHLAERLSREAGEIQAMLALEMIGYTSAEPRAQRYPPFMHFFYPQTADFIALVGNRPSRNLLKTVLGAFRTVSELNVETLTVPIDGWLTPATRLSDHAPFWDRGIPAVMVTDTAFFRNPNYHSPTDTPDTLDFRFLARVTEAVTRTMARLAGVE